MRRKYRIHPAIGIARVGDSRESYFIGPEVPGVPPSLKKLGAPPSPRGKYKDSQKRIKRQGARFRVFEYTYEAGNVLTEVREITAAEARIDWTVHLVNRKAAAPKFVQNGRRNAGVRESELIIDAGRQKVSGAEQDIQRLEGFFKGMPVSLGDLLTDSAGRLIVLGGFGRSCSVPAGRPILHFANNDAWCDDVSDGPVKATLHFHGAAVPIQAEAAWVIVAPPDFAPPIENVISLYDVVYEAMTKLHRSLDIADRMPISFTQHIYPILRRVAHYHWVSNLARRGHGPGTAGDFLLHEQLELLSNNAKAGHTDDEDSDHSHPEDAEPPHPHETEAPDHDQPLAPHPDHPHPSAPAEARQHIFEHLRNPRGGGGDMPMLNTLEARDPVALTEFQYRLMQRWAEGDFASDWTGQPSGPQSLDEISPEARPHALDRAALEGCVGGGFFPGIEAGRIMREATTYSRQSPFRISTRLKPGTLTAKMAVPWQADFRDCGSGWWPAQRPNQVIRDGPEPEQWIPNQWKRETLVERWSELGFIVKKKTGGKERFVEDERNF